MNSPSDFDCENGIPFTDLNQLSKNVFQFGASSPHFLTQTEADDLFLYSAGDNHQKLAQFLTQNYKYQRQGITPLMPNFDLYFDQKLLNENISRFRTSHLEILSQNEANDLFLFSAGNNNVALALFLVINYKFEQSGVSPLMIAAQNNNAELVKIFKQQNGRKDVYGTTALMYAVLNDADAAVQELAKYELHEVNNQNMAARDIALALHADQSIVQILECAQC
ncbi:Ankyrin_repeat protein 1 [Hexamita inflata]|uniref:Ankyrin repeat protein 1 n=1 Tax=Hexamita inflata TaxID=28002 RepID=A0AA86NQP3_9EUKA|nr:Ankyrin repeat protein 1 [Hexamita inflata]